MQSLQAVKSRPELFSVMEASALNVPKIIIDRCISNAEAQISEVNKSIDNFQDEYQKMKEFYESAKAEYLKVETQMQGYLKEREEQEVIIKTFKHAGKKDLPMNVLSMPQKEQNNALSFKPNVNGRALHVNWYLEGENVLRMAGRFLTEEELWKAFSDNKELVKNANKNKTQFPQLRGAVLDSIIRNALGFRKSLTSNSGKRVQYFGLYKGKIGLAAWLTADEVPVTEHIKEFMHEDYKEGRAAFDVRAKRIKAVTMNSK